MEQTDPLSLSLLAAHPPPAENAERTGGDVSSSASSMSTSSLRTPSSPGNHSAAPVELQVCAPSICAHRRRTAPCPHEGQASSARWRSPRARWISPPLAWAVDFRTPSSYQQAPRRTRIGLLTRTCLVAATVKRRSCVATEMLLKLEWTICAAATVSVCCRYCLCVLLPTVHVCCCCYGVRIRLDRRRSMLTITLFVSLSIIFV